ncbi:MAG TPA: ArgE/DapE family deacylase [Ornithinimicrobium sp.]|uniref:ArgE/DapE family deacylase n=1 Tax=Ornithinimicrobium sp. TaxID=1977084 RepID=UPI002B45C782|nr:ArgE/DapE family deacylase [Ornithinimicrobium sp.]HKJ12401.1 ArgE/DapE family deacylase [Ornithinimicrobium sp.]
MPRSTGSADGRSVDAVEDTVLRRIDADEVCRILRRLVQARGENPPGEEAERAGVLQQLAEEAGLEHHAWEVEPGRPNVQVSLDGGGGSGLLLLGHTDVVPVGEGWSRDPFGAEVEGGRMYGRGTSDMLGGLAASLAAMSAVRRAGVELSGPVVLASLVDEEENGLGVRDWIGGGADAVHDGGLHGCIVAEPTDLQPIIAARGACNLDITVTGVPAHAGNPDDGRNAIAGAAVVVADLERWHTELAAAPAPLVGPATVNVGAIEGGLGASTVPDRCHLRVDRRLVPGEPAADVVAEVTRRIAALGLEDRGLGVEVVEAMDMPGFATAADDPFVTTVDGALRDAGGPGAEPGGWSAACDGGFVATHWGVPVMVLGPGSVHEQAHRPDESVSLEEVVTATRAYALAILRVAGVA